MIIAGFVVERQHARMLMIECQESPRFYQARSSFFVFCFDCGQVTQVVNFVGLLLALCASSLLPGASVLCPA